jgi:hypothetical protein
MPFSAASSPRGRIAYSILALSLAGAAGAVNATSLFAFGQHITHMTGHVSAVGEALASGQWASALAAGRLVLAFVVGHLGLLTAFLFGSCVGSELFLSYGPSTMGLPCVVLLLVMALDLSPAGAHTPAPGLQAKRTRFSQGEFRRRSGATGPTVGPVGTPRDRTVPVVSRENTPERTYSSWLSAESPSR